MPLGRETLIAGSSPLQMVLATELLANGGRVSTLLDEKTLKKKLAFLPHIKNHWPKLLEGGFHMGKMALPRPPMEQGIRILLNNAWASLLPIDIHVIKN
jgi:hypothetical protein